MKRGKDGSLHLPSDHLYYAQVQGEMAIIGVEWCDFVVYSNDSVIVDRIIADADYWNHLSERLEQFYVTHVIPEILFEKILMEEFDLHEHTLFCLGVNCVLHVYSCECTYKIPS